LEIQLNAKNEDADVVALAQQLFGEGNDLFTNDMWLKELHPALMAYARQNPNRAIEVREFVDLHRLGFLDKKDELSEILKEHHAKKMRDDGPTNNDDLHDWALRTRADIKAARSKSGRSSFGERFRKFISRRR
jgi:hypothetical protein